MKKNHDFVPWETAELPEQTETYMPVAHFDLITLVEERLAIAGYDITRRNVEQSTDGTTIIAHFILKKSIHADFGFTQEFAVVSDYNKRKSIMFASGGHVFICGNGMVVSEVTIVRKHTSRVWEEIEDRCDEAISNMESNWKKLMMDVMSMHRVELNLTQKAEILGRLLIEEEILTSTEISKIRKEMKKPTFSYGAEDTLWELYNYATLVLKDAHIMRKTKALKDLHDFMVEYANDYIAVHIN